MLVKCSGYSSSQFNQSSISQPNFYNTNIAGVAGLNGTTAEPVINSNIDEGGP